MFKIKTKDIFVFMAVIGLLIFLHFIKVLQPIENIIIFILNPLTSGIHSVSTDLRTAYDKQTDKRDLLKVVLDLEERTKQLMVENTELDNLREENEKLRQHLKFLTKNEFDYILANIIFRDVLEDSTSLSQVIIIDKGSQDGLYPGLAVVSSQGILVGKVAEVKKNIAKVLLVTDSKCKLAAAMQSQDSHEAYKTIGVAEGELGLTIKMNFIPQTKKIEVGDTVVTSGLEKDIERGLLIGQVTQVDNSSNEVWQSVTIEPLADLDDLFIVSILLPKENIDS